MPALSSIGATALSLTGEVATPAGRGVYLKADANNSGSIYVGYTDAVTAGTPDATSGIRLSAGNEYVVPPSLIGAGTAAGADAQNIWVIGSGAGQKIYFDVL